MVQKLLFNNLLHKRKLETSKSVNLASKTCKNGLSKKIRISTPWVIDPCLLTVQVTFFFLSYVYVWNCTSLRPIYLLYCISLVSRPIWNLKLLKYKKHASDIEEIGAIFHEAHRAGHVVMPLGLCEHCFSAYSFFFALSTWQTPIHLSRDNSTITPTEKLSLTFPLQCPFPTLSLCLVWPPIWPLVYI